MHPSNQDMKKENWEKEWKEDIFYNSRSADQIKYIRSLLHSQASGICSELAQFKSSYVQTNTVLDQAIEMIKKEWGV